MENMRDLFVYELSHALESEQMIADILPEMAEESNSEEISMQLRRHEQETQQQIENLERSFDLMGMEPQDVEPVVIEALLDERETFKGMRPAEHLLMTYDLGAAAKTEHLEMAMYKGLIEKAGMLGETEIQGLLQQNMQQEERMARQIEQLAANMNAALMRQAV